MKYFSIFLGLSLSFGANADIREGGRTVGAGQVVEIVSKNTGLTQKEVNRTMRKTRNILAKRIDKATPMLMGSLYFDEGIDQDCDGIARTMEEGTQCTSVVFKSGEGDEGVLKVFLENALSDGISQIAAAQDYNSSRSNNSSRIQEEDNQNTSRSRAPIVAIGSNTWQDLTEKLTITEIFSDARLCEVFRQQFGQVTQKRSQEIDLDGEFARKHYDKLTASMEEHVKTYKRKQKTADADLTADEVKTEVARRSRLTPDQVGAIFTEVSRIAKDALSRGYAFEIPHIGVIDIPTKVRQPGQPVYGNITFETKIATKNVVKFKAGSDLSKKVKSSNPLDSLMGFLEDIQELTSGDDIILRKRPGRIRSLELNLQDLRNEIRREVQNN